MGYGKNALSAPCRVDLGLTQYNAVLGQKWDGKWDGNEKPAENQRVTVVLGTIETDLTKFTRV